MTTPEIIEKLADLKAEKAEAQARLDDVEASETFFKQLLQDSMIESGSRRTEAYSGYYATRVQSHRKYVNVADAKEWLEANPDVPTDSLYKFNDAAYKTLAEKHLKTTGERLPGIQVQDYEYVTIKEEK